MTCNIIRQITAGSRNIITKNGNAMSKVEASYVLMSTQTIQEVQNKLNSTVDLNDVERHSKFVKSWWDINGTSKALHAFNVIRVPFVRDGLVQCPSNERSIVPLKNKKILDVGCGGGILTEALARLGGDVTGIDASAQLVNLAQEHASSNLQLSNKPSYIHTTIEEHAVNHAGQYDAVVASEVIEHVDNKELFVKSCTQILKPGGRIFFTTPNRTRASQALVIYLTENILKFVPKGIHQYEKFITPTELTFLLERHHCHVELTHGLMYNFISNRWSWMYPQTLMYALQAVKIK